jgi:serine/threonine-protein kinase
MTIKSFLRFLLFFGIFIIVAVAAALFTMEILTGGKTVSVPDLRDKEIVKAGRLLKNAGLTLRIEGEEFHPAIPKDYIISQNPEAGTIIKEGRSVGVIVSKGPQEVVVPRLEMEPLRRAEVIIRQNGLTVGDIAKVHSMTVEKDLIITQNPLPGSITDRGERVDLLVSLGPEDLWYKTPNLLGKKLEEGSTILEKIGIEITITTAKGEEPGLILGQKPKSGYPIRKGDRLELIVSE